MCYLYLMLICIFKTFLISKHSINTFTLKIASQLATTTDNSWGLVTNG